MTSTTRLLLSLLAVTLPAAMAFPVADAAAEGASKTRGLKRPVRIGLGGDPVKRRVFADGGIVVRDPLKGEPIWKRKFDPGVYFVSDSSGGGKSPIYRVQVASFTSKEAAATKKAEIEAVLPREKVVLVYHPDRKAWRVRVGEVRSREETAPIVQRLSDEGYDELWVTEEGEAVSGRRRVRIVDDHWKDFLTGYDRVLIEPARAGAMLRVGEATYRGTLEAKVDRSGNLRLINEVDMEQYLRGVVPNEMGPGVYPELEALKAQAVAARTYIVANLGQFSEDGYDICDSPSCQVYRGAGSEHSMTDQALQETRGVVLTWDGEAINAMYTSTCGGHTEDGHLVFPEEKGPYLKGVPCYPESEPLPLTISGDAWIEPVILEDGHTVNEEIHLLQQHGVVGPEALSRAYLLTYCNPLEATTWFTRALALVGKRPSAEGLDGEELRLHAMVSYVARSVGWKDWMRVSLDERDLPYLLAFDDWEKIPESARRPYAVLIQAGIMEPFPDNTLRPDHVPSRGYVLGVIYRLLDYYHGFGRERAIYRGSKDGKLLLEIDRDRLELGVSPEVALFRDFQNVPYPTRSVPLTLGDRVLIHRSAEESIDYLKLIAKLPGVSDDRYSSLYRWEQRVSRDELQKSINARVRIGRLIDIEPARRGVSGRVVELKVRGSRGLFYLRGFRIRTALGIRETLFTVDRTRSADGRVEEFIFSGKGWGHGVGLCQVGAYGMALRGKSYDEILRHYYSGAELTRIDDLEVEDALAADAGDR